MSAANAASMSVAIRGGGTSLQHNTGLNNTYLGVKKQAQHKITMLHTLNADVLGVIISHIGDPTREIDDVARDAAALAVVGSSATTQMSKLLWKRVSFLASLLHPSPHAQAIESHCIGGNVITKAHVRGLARACGIKYYYYWGLEHLTHELEHSDKVVGQHCPIPRSAALYVLHMICRLMTHDVAKILFAKHDISACRQSRRGVVYADLRRAPLRACDSSFDARKLELEKLDRFFVGRDRPWFVRTEAQAMELFRRERMVADRIPSICYTWSMEAAYEHRDVCAALRLGGGWGTKHGPSWGTMRHHGLRLIVPHIFQGCTDASLPHRFTLEHINALKARIASHIAHIDHLPACILYDTRVKLLSGVRPPEFPRFNMQQAVDAVFLNTLDLPVKAVHWGIDDWDRLCEKAACAQEMSAYFGVAVIHDLDIFYLELLEEMRKRLMTPPFDACDLPCYGDGGDVTMQMYESARVVVDKARKDVEPVPEDLLNYIRTYGDYFELQDFVDLALDLALELDQMAEEPET